MKNYVLPLTKTMIAKLEYCRSVELKGELCLPEDIKYALAPLYKRGYIGLKKAVINNKELMTVFATPEGIHCLEKLQEKKTAKQD